LDIDDRPTIDTAGNLYRTNRSIIALDGDSVVKVHSISELGIYDSRQQHCEKQEAKLRHEQISRFSDSHYTLNVCDSLWYCIEHASMILRGFRQETTS
jgi:hypothetical protein